MLEFRNCGMTIANLRGYHKQELIPTPMSPACLSIVQPPCLNTGFDAVGLLVPVTIIQVKP